jgi:hypothetical protein
MVFLLVDRKSPNYYEDNNPTKNIKLNGWYMVNFLVNVAFSSHVLLPM